MRFLVLSLLLAIAAPAAGQGRIIPPDAALALLRNVNGKVMQVRLVQGNLVQASGTLLELSPGAQIRDPSNHIVFPEMLPPEVLVRFSLEPNGLLHRVWVLTPEEAAQIPPAPQPQPAPKPAAQPPATPAPFK